MSVTYSVFDQGLSESLSAFVSRLDAFLQGLGPIAIQDVALSRRLTIGTIRYELTIQHNTGSALFRAAYFAQDNDAALEADVAAFFALQPQARIQFVRDVSQESRRSLVQNAVLAIYTSTAVPNIGPDRGRPLVVQAVGAIASGATGAAALVSSSGVLAATVQVVNRSGSAWGAGDRGYAAARPNGVWDGYPSCC